jgi:hypothetical protein
MKIRTPIQTAQNSKTIQAVNFQPRSTSAKESELFWLSNISFLQVTLSPHYHSRDQRINSPRNPQITIIFKTQTATIKSPSRESLLEANRENRKSVFIYCSIIFWLEFASLLVVGTSIDSPVRNQIRRRIKWPPWPIKEMQSTCNNLHTRSNTLLCLFNWIVTCRADGQGHPAVFQQCTTVHTLDYTDK